MSLHPAIGFAEGLAQIQRIMPQAKIVEIPNGHHYCFIKQEGLVFDEMRKFLIDA
jgi:hypothetical protein